MPKKVLSRRVTNQRGRRARLQRQNKHYTPVHLEATRGGHDLTSIDHMRHILFFFIIGLFACTEVGAGILFLVVRNADVLVLLTIPSLAFYQVICYVFPTKRMSTQFLLLIQSLFRK